ncbi:MAG: pyridoxal phosphate-dependent aminotransferase [Clostridiales Family XIII bacterium]|nr:pyridoxal phosphate-dependent aminotransferase [Clostridiales Family XIII bacterium]
MGRVSKAGRAVERSKIREMKELCEQFDNVISFAIGEPDFITPQHIIDSAIDALKKGRTKYAPNAGIPELRQAIAERLKRTHGVSYEWSKEIIITGSGMDNLRLVFQAILDPEDEVLIPDPTWSNHPNHPILAAGKSVMTPVYEKDGFMYDVSVLEQHVTDRTKAVLLNSPSNPTGGAITGEQLTTFCDFCKRHDLIVVSDEVYEQIIYDGLKFYSPAMVEGMKERVVVCNSFSKTYAMTGWRLGYAAGPADIIHGMEILNENSISCVNTFVQLAGVTALTSSQDCVSEMVKSYQRRRDLVYNAVNEIRGLSCIRPKGAMYAFVNIQETELSSEEFAKNLIVQKQICVVPGSGFGSAGEGFVRICYAVSDEDIAEGMKRIREYVDELMALATSPRL